MTWQTSGYLCPACRRNLIADILELDTDGTPRLLACTTVGCHTIWTVNWNQPDRR